MHNIILPADARDALKAVQMSSADPAPSLALQLAALTVSRIAPVRLAKLTDIDMDDATWRIPAHHNKSRTEQIPLSRQALSVFERAGQIERGASELVFPSKRGTVLSGSALPNLCRALKLGVRPSDFRRAFVVWCHYSCVPRELAEAALGHKLPYIQLFQSKFLEKRRPLMQAWADYLAGDLADNWRWHVAGEEDEHLKVKELLKLREKVSAGYPTSDIRTFRDRSYD